MKVGRTARFLAHFARATGGATAVEFAIVAGPFLFLLFSILEIGRLYTINSVLEDATMTAGRQVRTGTMQTSGASATQFKNAVCAEMSVFRRECSSRLSVDVRVMPQFASQTAPDPVTGDQFNEASLTYQPGRARDIILVRTWWRAPIFAPMVTQGLRRLRDGSVVLSAATTFRNEPYE